jgi:hypothetical protein
MFGIILLRISKTRKEKIMAILYGVLDAGSLTAAQASSLRGKLYFCMLTAFNKVGRAPLRSFTERQYSRDTYLSSEVRDSLYFFLHLIPNMLPKTVDLLSLARTTLIIWSDAMFEAKRGAIGFVAFDPDTERYYYSAYRVPQWVYRFFRVLKTYIGQLEILAVLFSYLTLPRQLVANRPVLHYIDNTSSMAGAIKGYSPKRDSAWMLTVLHLLLSTMNIFPWFEYVASKANCSDGPSRFYFDFVTGELAATWLPPICLTLSQWRQRLQDMIPTRPARHKRASGAQRRRFKRERAQQANAL